MPWAPFHAISVVAMTNIVDLNSVDNQSPLILLKQCKHLRRDLLERLQESFERISSDILPLFVDGSRLLHRAAERTWAPEHIDFALQEVRDLEFLCSQIEQLLRCYQEMLTAPSTTNATTSGTGNVGDRRPSDHG
jgi:hypothetical protein